jgi:hypothetical protein
MHIKLGSKALPALKSPTQQAMRACVVMPEQGNNKARIRRQSKARD